MTEIKIIVPVYFDEKESKKSPDKRMKCFSHYTFFYLETALHLFTALARKSDVYT